jgi:hypothetical protein
LVEEAEAPLAQPPADIFVLRWLELAVDARADAPLMASTCEISYQTCGSQSFGGLDRGRALSAMDAELLSMLEPPQTSKLNFVATPPAPMRTQVFWDEPVLGAIAAQKDRLSRSARVVVYSYQEQGE